MTYQTVAGFTQSLALVLFVVVFLGAFVYAIWPGNKEMFDHAARLPLQPDPEPETMTDTRKDAGARNG